MGRDLQPKERQRQQLARRDAVRATHDRVLIVSEGRKTEPNYFREICRDYRLHTANIEVRPSELGTAPAQVVEYARQILEHGHAQRKIPRRAFEQVYVVFDRDEHRSYADALTIAKSLDGKVLNDLKQRVRFVAIASIPCFELWLLLHFEDVQSPLHRDEVLERLKRHVPKYEKGLQGVFALTKSRVEVALERARRLARMHSAHTDPEPFTAVGELVSLLRSFAA